MVLIIDNYDSFTFNVYQALSTMTDKVKVLRNDHAGINEILRMDVSHLVISPGPGRPSGAGVSLEAVRVLSGRVPVLGVCLGHQTIGQVFGGKVVHARHLMHGKSSRITHSGNGLFHGLPNPLEAIRYHSLALDGESVPQDLMVTATSEDGEIMGVRHREYNVEGVQFHPESFGTEKGETIFENFLKLRGGIRNAA